MLKLTETLAATQTPPPRAAAHGGWQRKETEGKEVELCSAHVSAVSGGFSFWLSCVNGKGGTGSGVH